MNNYDLIRRGDALKIAREFCVGGYEGELEEALDALPAVKTETNTCRTEGPRIFHVGWADPIEQKLPTDAQEAALLSDLAQVPIKGELTEPWIKRMMLRATGLLKKSTNT